MATHRIIQGDCLEGLRTLPDASVHCCVTSPPYWGLRDYGHASQIGLEATPEAYVARMVDVFREVRRVLREDGTCWVNLGDSYAATTKQTGRNDNGQRAAAPASWNCRYEYERTKIRTSGGLKPKDLVGIPWRVAFALQADGWWLRQDIIWHKPNPMPESVRDRCTKAHEYVFLLTKSERYFYDAEAVSEAAATAGQAGLGFYPMRAAAMNRKPSGNEAKDPSDGIRPLTRNRRSVWTITTKPYSGAHFAVMPPDLVEPCIKAGCPEGGTVLDPFAGSGTTLAVAAQLGRNGIGCELNPEYIKLAEERVAKAKAKLALFDSVA
jgi:DNA modification methylase